MRGWLGRYRRKNPGATLGHILWWDLVCHPIAWLIVFVLYRHRWWNIHNIPAEGPTLLVCNHQSYLDLPVLGVGIYHRHFHPMARKTLFRNPVFGRLIRSLNAFEVDQESADIRSVRTAIDKLKAGHLVLLFPEGARTEDGRMGPFNPGLMLLIRRARPTVVPMAVDGVYDAWPINRKWPRLSGATGAEYGEPIPAKDLIAMPPEEARKLLRHRVETLRLSVRQRLRRRTRGRYPLPGQADHYTADPTDAGADDDARTGTKAPAQADPPADAATAPADSKADA